MLAAFRRPARVVVLLLALALVVGGCGVPSGGSDDPAAGGVLDDPAALAEAGVARLRPRVVGTLPHYPWAFTQGLELEGNSLWEGTGRRGRSQLREIDPVNSGVRRAVDLPPQVFGEGITVLPGRIWQLTWTDEVVYDRDPRTLAVRRTLPLDREGWGVCHDGRRLVSSDGSDELVFRNQDSFAPTGTVRVTAAGEPVSGLNELECTPRGVWANVWPTDHIVRIDPGTGRITAVVDAAGLLPPDQRAGTDVLNGIAWVPGTDQFLITGKLWPTIFRVRFVPG